MELQAVGIKFDPAPAKRGADEAKKAVKSMADSVARDLDKVEASGKDAGRVVKKSGDQIERASADAKRGVDKLGKTRGFKRLAEGARGSTGAISGGVIDMLDTFGLLNNRIGMMVRRAQSGVNSLGRLRGAMGGAATGARGAGVAAASAGGGMATAAGGATALAGGATAATGAMGAMATVAAVLLPIVVALAAALAGVAAVGTVFKALKAGIPKAAAFESAETGLAVLMGSFDKAADKMEEIKKFSGATPFESTELIQGARYLETFTEGLMNNVEGWTLVGDAAAAAQRDFGEVAMWTGRMYAALKGGQPIGEATMRLMEMGLITPQVKGEMDKLAASSNEGGKNFVEIWGKAEDALKRFSGTMALQSTTWAGLMSTLKDNWSLLLAGFADPVMDALKPALQEVIGLVQRMIPYAEKFGQALANGITIAIELVRSGEIERGLMLAFAAAFEFARANLVTAMQLAMVVVVKLVTEGLSNAMTMPIRLFASLMAGAIDVITSLITGDWQGAVATVLKFFGDGGNSVVKTMGTVVYNSLGQAFEDAVNVFRDAFFKVWQSAANLMSEGLTRLGKDPLDPVPIPARLDFFQPKEVGFGDIRGAANDMVGTGARDALGSYFDEMLAKAKDRQGPAPTLPDSPDAGMTPVEEEVKTGGGGGGGNAKQVTAGLRDQRTELQRLTDDWGNLHEQIDRTATGAAHAIAGGMGDAIHGLIMGTKDAKTAFTDMAVSIVSDILRMILQMQIQLALAAALRAMGYGGGGAMAHSGGEVGTTNLASSGGGRVQLPTYHSGGMATSEQAIKVEKGESILTRKRAKELEMELSAQRGQQGGQQRGQGEMTIINVTDRQEVADAVMARPEAVVNAISRQLPAVRKMVMSGQRI